MASWVHVLIESYLYLVYGAANEDVGVLTAYLKLPVLILVARFILRVSFTQAVQRRLRWRLESDESCYTLIMYQL